MKAMIVKLLTGKGNSGGPPVLDDRCKIILTILPLNSIIMRYFIRLLLLVSSISTTVAHGQSKSRHHVDTSTYVVFKYSGKSDLFFGKSDHFRPTTLSTSEVDEMESLVDSAYQRLVKELPPNYFSLKALSGYKRQYVATINGKGQKEIWIGFFCDVPENWRKNEVLVEDGGACYLRLWVNLTLRKASKLFDNAEA